MDERPKRYRASYKHCQWRKQRAWVEKPESVNREVRQIVLLVLRVWSTWKRALGPWWRELQINTRITTVKSTGFIICWSGHHFYENSTSGLFSFLERWSHRQHIDKRLAWRQTINNRQATLASGLFSYKVTLRIWTSSNCIPTLHFSIKYIYFVPYTLSTRFSFFIHLITSTQFCFEIPTLCYSSFPQWCNGFRNDN